MVSEVHWKAGGEGDGFGAAPRPDQRRLRMWSCGRLRLDAPHRTFAL